MRSWSKRYLGRTVLDEAVARVLPLYADGHRVVVSMSGGKDSTVAMEICRIAAKMTNRLPVEVMHRDDEIMYPGTFEYLERVANDPEISMNWWHSNEACNHFFSRRLPFYWPFDPRLPESQWVRRPPAVARFEDSPLTTYVRPERFRPAAGRKLYDIIALRANESLNRIRAIFATHGHLTRQSREGTTNVRPTYDWTDRDEWRFIQETGCDYNRAYDVLNAIGVPRTRQRVGSFAITWAVAIDYPKKAKAWPEWHGRVVERLGPEIEEVAQRGPAALRPKRLSGELWWNTFMRECVAEAPGWVADRARLVAEQAVARHARHSREAFPDSESCLECLPRTRSARVPKSWREVTNGTFMGDVWGFNTSLPQVTGASFREVQR